MQANFAILKRNTAVRFTNFHLILMMLVLWLISAGFAWGTVISTDNATEISLGDFDNPKVLDFESAVLGSIVGTDALFTDFGIQQISGTGSGFNEFTEGDQTKSLWLNPSGLVIVDSSVGNGNFGGDSVSYTLDFDTSRKRFGTGSWDAEGFTDYTFRFFAGGFEVGNAVKQFNIFGNLEMVYFEADSFFDRVTIEATGSASGFALDNITLETAPIPEPSSGLLFVAGLLGIVGASYRFCKNTKRHEA